MGGAVRRQIELLVRLQSVEREISQLERREQELPGGLDGLEQELGELCRRIEDREGQLEELRRQRLRQEDDLQVLQQRLRRATEKLDGAKNEREYRAARRELEELEQSRARQEEELLRLSAELEDLRAHQQEDQRRREALQGELAERRSRLAEELGEVQRSLERLRQEREQLRGEVEPSLLRRFYLIMERRQGRAVVPVRDGSCSGCYMHLPPQLANEVQRGASLITCPHCSRVLYWEEEG